MRSTNKNDIKGIAMGQSTGEGRFIDQIEDGFKSSKNITKEFESSQKLKLSHKQSSLGTSIADENNKSTTFVKRETESLIFLDHSCVAYKFKGTKPIGKGQYRLPFTMKLP